MHFFNMSSPKNKPVDFETAVFSGSAPNGGLFMPVKVPIFSRAEIEAMKNKDFRQTAAFVMKKWLSESLPESVLNAISKRAFIFDVPLKKVGPYYVLELFHGPSLAFKDVAARFLASYMEHICKQHNRTLNIITATSGDTGGAIASAFSDIPGIQVFILFPKDSVSALQYEQLTRVDANIYPIEIDGTFDDCQALAKQALTDVSLPNMTSANSINIGRLLPQTTYYVYAAAKLGAYEAIIPTGNLGNATAGLFAAQMKAGPVHMTLACNSNDAILRYAKTGLIKKQRTKRTLSNAMDVGLPNNLGRFIERLDKSLEAFNDYVSVASVSDAETIETIQLVYEQCGYLLDPHTAVAWTAASKRPAGNLPKLIVSTASPMKFSEEIYNHTRIKSSNAALLQTIRQKRQRLFQCKAQYKNIKNFVLEHQ